MVASDITGKPNGTPPFIIHLEVRAPDCGGVAEHWIWAASPHRTVRRNAPDAGDAIVHLVIQRSFRVSSSVLRGAN